MMVMYWKLICNKGGAKLDYIAINIHAERDHATCMLYELVSKQRSEEANYHKTNRLSVSPSEQGLI